MKKLICAVKVAACCLVAVLLTGCAKEKMVLNPKSPTVVTLWHSYNAFAKTVFDDMVLEFNETQGMELGIVVNAYGFGTSKELDDALYQSANHMLGSEPLPDIITVYPDSAYRLNQLEPLVDLNEYFTQEELSQFRPEFLKEGIWEDSESIKMIPVAKSTELLYLNATRWERFSEETGMSVEDLHSWEGLLRVSEAYYDWSDGKPFLGMNGFNDFATMTLVQLDVEPFVHKNGQLMFQYPEQEAKKVWDIYYVPHILGWYKSQQYNQDGLKRGELMAYIGSSAGAGYFPEEVIETENHTYPVECVILPYPSFEGKQEYMTQRGAGMSVFSSDREHEYASVQFLKWFTQPGQNMDFAVSTGYIPVQKEALESVSELLSYVPQNDNHEAVKKSVAAVLQIMSQREFYCKKTFWQSFEVRNLFEEALDKKIELDSEEIRIRVRDGEDRAAVTAEYLTDENFQEWYHILLKEMSEKLHG